MSQEDTMRLVAEVVDKYSGPMKDMQRSLRELSKATKGAHESSASAAREHTKHMKELGESFKKVREVAVDLMTPALAGVGITGLTAAEGIKSVVEACRRMGEAGRVFEMIGNRSGMSAKQIQLVDEAAAQAGISVDQMNEGLANMGEFLDQTRKGMPEALKKWNEMPGAFERFGKAMVGAKRDAVVGMALDDLDQMTDKGQKRQFLALLGLPQDWASFSRDTIEDIVRTTRQSFKNHPALDPEQAAKADESWRHLQATIRGLGRDFQDLVTPEVVAGMDKVRDFFENPQNIDKFKQAVHGAMDELKSDFAAVNDIIRGWQNLKIIENHDIFGDKSLRDELDANPNARPGTFDERWNRLPSPEQKKLTDQLDKSPFGGLWTPMAFRTGDDRGPKETIQEAVKSGVLEAFREWAGISSSHGSGSTGFTNASYSTSSIGGASIHSGSGYKLLDGGLPSKSTKGVVDHLNGTAEVPAGSGPRPTGMKGSKREVAKIMRDEWKRAGMSDEGIAGIMANVQDESQFNPTLRHSDQPRFSGEAHFAHGLYQEGGAEWNHYASWLQKNYPGADWRDPRLQSRFAAENLKKNYPGVWRQMNSGDRFHAGAAYVDGYLKPAAGYRASRVNKYLRGGVGPLDHYTGPMEADQHSHHGASIFDHIRHKHGSLGKHAARAAGLVGPAGTITGEASLRIDLNGFPKGTRTASSASGLFKEVSLNRGRAMAMASEDG
jgi:tail lysozyme